jgi:hypothetical protein
MHYPDIGLLSRASPWWRVAASDQWIRPYPPKFGRCYGYPDKGRESEARPSEVVGAVSWSGLGCVNEFRGLRCGTR